MTSSESFLLLFLLNLLLKEEEIIEDHLIYKDSGFRSIVEHIGMEIICSN